EYLLAVPRGGNLREALEGSADNIDAAHEFVGTPVGVDAIHDERYDGESLEAAAAGCRIASRNTAEKQAVRLTLTLQFFDEHPAELRVRHRASRVDDQIRLSTYRFSALLLAAVAVRGGEAAYRRPGHEKGLQ